MPYDLLIFWVVIRNLIANPLQQVCACLLLSLFLGRSQHNTNVKGVLPNPELPSLLLKYFLLVNGHKPLDTKFIYQAGSAKTLSKKTVLLNSVVGSAVNKRK